MTESDLAGAVNVAIDKTPAFTRAVRTNYLNRLFLEAIVDECARDKRTGKLLPPSKAQRAFQRAAEGKSQASWSRRLLRGATQTPLARVVAAIKLHGRSGRRPQSEARRDLDDFFGGLSSEGAALYAMKGQRGSPALDISDSSSDAVMLVAKLAHRYNVPRDRMLAAVNKSRAWLADTFDRTAIENVRRDVRRKLST